MPKTLADAKKKVTSLTSLPENPEAVPVAELTAGKDIQCNVLKSDFRLSAVASDTVPDTELCSDSNATAFGASNFEGNMTPFRYYDETGVPDPTEDFVWDLAKEKGTHLYLAIREGKPHDDPWVATDEYTLWHVITDEPQDPTDTGGFIKKVIPLGVQRRYKGAVAAAG
ncbi:hypothetical protein [Isoptericola sp. QY 916]|uniref:phage tail tube protein n=1 Tax=Isoptericola sp. QY 916 TaxID=2782570 RepID=UPI003D2FA103|nr:hypothetical protein [Isoptericola sp. QY 916]